VNCDICARPVSYSWTLDRTRATCQRGVTVARAEPGSALNAEADCYRVGFERAVRDARDAVRLMLSAERERDEALADARTAGRGDDALVVLGRVLEWAQRRGDKPGDARAEVAAIIRAGLPSAPDTGGAATATLLRGYQARADAGRRAAEKAVAERDEARADLARATECIRLLEECAELADRDRDLAEGRLLARLREWKRRAAMTDAEKDLEHAHLCRDIVFAQPPEVRR